MVNLLLTPEELLRYVPAAGRKYWTLEGNVLGNIIIVDRVWQDSLVDVSRLKVGWVFDTYSEAVAAYRKIKEEMK